MWISRSLLQGPRVAVVFSQRQFQRAARAIGEGGDQDPYCEPHMHACVHAYDAVDGLACIVGINAARLAQLDPIDVAALLVHEAVHIWQRTRIRLGPGDLGVEMEAYAIQNLSAELMRAYVSAVGRA